MRKGLIAFVGLTLASFAMGQLAKHKDWQKSPEAYFLTPAEREEWSKVKSDEEAEKFISLYWAKRGPRFHDEVSRRIAAADEQFKLRRQKGSESVRGRLLITLGPPSRVLQERAQERESVSPPESGTSTETLLSSGRSTFTQTWIYEKDRVDPAWNVSELRVRISVDPQRGSDELTVGAAVERVIARVAEKSIVNPGGQVGAVGAAPAVKPAVPAAATGPAAPPASVAATLPAAVRSALEALLREKNEQTSHSFWGGPFRTIPGESFYAFQFYVGADKASTAPVKFGGVVVTDSGEQAASYWEDAPLSDMKTGARIDKVFERSVVLPPGTYRGAFGLFAGDAAIASSWASFRLPPKSNEFEISPLILGNTLTPLTKRPSPTDPFVFGMEKPIRVEPKANRLFTREDGLWYFYTVSNAAVPEAPSAAAPTPTPAAGAPTTAGGVPAATPAPTAAKPRIMTRIGVLRNGEPAFQPMTAPAELQVLGPGYYATGSEIPLASFEPGYYTFTLNVRDLNAPKDSVANSKGIDRKEDFVVLKTDGSMPDKPAPKPTAAPKPKAGKKPS